MAGGQMAWDLKEPECISQARLLVASPEFVYDQIKYYGDNSSYLSGKEQLEKLLLQRDDKLINLALAEFAVKKETIQSLFDRSKTNDDAGDTYHLGLRVACLSNRHFGFFNWPNFDLDALMSKGLTEESYALLTNPSINDKVLEALYKKADCFAQVGEGDWMHMIVASAENERLNQDESNDSGPDMGLYSIHNAIFSFLENAPVTEPSVYATAHLLCALEPEHTVWPEAIEHVIERWRHAEVKDYKGDIKEGWSTHLALTEELACLD
jgi:hypothetical protein